MSYIDRVCGKMQEIIKNYRGGHKGGKGFLMSQNLKKLIKRDEDCVICYCAALQAPQ